MLHSPLQDLINFLPLFANPRHFLVIARLDQRDDEDGNDRHDILVPRGHSMYIHGYVLAASPSGRNRINMIQSSPQCVPALLHQPPPTTERHTYNRGWHIGSGWRYCQCQVMGNAWCVLVYRETDRETRNCSYLFYDPRREYGTQSGINNQFLPIQCLPPIKQSLMVQ